MHGSEPKTPGPWLAWVSRLARIRALVLFLPMRMDSFPIRHLQASPPSDSTGSPRGSSAQASQARQAAGNRDPRSLGLQPWKSNVRLSDDYGAPDVRLLERNGIADEEAADLAFDPWLSSPMILNLAPRCISYGVVVAMNGRQDGVCDLLKLRVKSTE